MFIEIKTIVRAVLFEVNYLLKRYIGWIVHACGVTNVITTMGPYQLQVGLVSSTYRDEITPATHS